MMWLLRPSDPVYRKKKTCNRRMHSTSRNLLLNQNIQPSPKQHQALFSHRSGPPAEPRLEGLQLQVRIKHRIILAWHRQTICKLQLVWNLSVHFRFPKGSRPKCLRTQLDRPTSNHSNETGDAALSGDKIASLSGCQIRIT